MGAWTLRASDFAGALGQLRLMAREARGHAAWSFEADRLRVAWGGVAVEVAAVGDATARATVRATVMRGVVKLPMPVAGDHVLRLEQGRLYLDGSFSVPCELRREAAPQLLPVSPSPLDVALLGHRHTPAELEAAGLAPLVAKTRARTARASRSAARSLAFLGITEAQVEAWVESHLSTLAAPKTPT